MNRKTQEWLHQLLWLADCLSRPTFRNLTDTFEGWASRRGLLRQIQRLEAEQLIESPGATLEKKIYRLTNTGRLAALGGREPEAYWNRRWDGRWRLVVFDLPETKNKVRVRLRRFLQEQYFGYLQNSVWITPDPLDPMAKILQQFTEDVESLILLEAHQCGGESNAAIVQGAWEFERINCLYSEYLETLEQLSRMDAEGSLSTREWDRWSRRERSSWFEIMESDPLLPRSLLPVDYLGVKAWEARKQAARVLVRRLVKR
jgi:phenylacetic acid degradation operon negative regulatory protein